jgi:integrase
MGRKRLPGLIMRAGIWHVDKRIGGRRVCRSTETTDLQEAERYLARVMEQTRQAQVYGVRPSRTFEQAAAKYVLETKHKRTIGDDVKHLKQLVPLLSKTPLDRIHRGTLQPWVELRQRQGRAAGTINHGLKVVRRILNLAAGEWVDDQGLTWLPAAPKIKLLADVDKRQPHPLNWDEQSNLFRELPDYLAQMALFAVNTGCRDQEVCRLRWEWEVKVPELGTSVFIIPGSRVKNGDERLVVLNRVSRSIVDGRRRLDKTFVFTCDGHALTRMMTSAWKRARQRIDLPNVRVHDLKHTFGRRLRAAGVSFEDRQDLLGHRSGRITTHYSAAELSRLLAAAESVVERDGSKPELIVLRGALQGPSRKTLASAELVLAGKSVTS